MKLHACLGLSKYDMNTVFYYVLVFSLCLTFNLYIHWFNNDAGDGSFSCAMVVATLFNSFMYILGFLAGIIIARSTAHENLESLMEDKSGVVSDVNAPLSVI